MRDDLYGGLRNALDRGATLEQAVRSMINAGYPEIEVREAAQALQNASMLSATLQNQRQSEQQKTGFIGKWLTRSPSTPSNPVKPNPSLSTQVPLVPRKQPMPPSRVQPQTLTSFELKTPRDRTTALIIVCSVILLLSVVGLASSILFKDQLSIWFPSLFG